METEEKDVAEKTEVPNLAMLLKEFPEAPTDIDIEKWKQQFGEVFVSGFSEKELLVWRPLKRVEFVNLQKKLRTPPTSPEIEPATELDFEEWVVKACVLWSSNGEIFAQKGGTVSTLSEQIMTNSNFMPPAMASMLVMKL